MKNLKRLLKVLAVLVGLGALGIAGFLGLTHHRYTKTYAPPFPAVVADSTAEGLVRGRQVFMASCAPCHVSDDGARATGHVLEFPAFFGTVHAANVTQDPVGGVGAWSDAELARMIRTEIGRDGHFRPMPAGGPFMSDADLAAVIGFMRSADPLFQPVAQRAPKSDVTLMGELIFVWFLTIPHDAPVKIERPAHEPSVELGRYFADVGECWQCHTDGFSKSKRSKPGQYSGGFQMADHQGRTIITSNLTPDDTGLGGRKWSVEQFITAMRDGVTPDGRVLRMPMPRYRYADDVELRALWAYLQSLPKVSRTNQAGTAPELRASESMDPAVLWSALGCNACHGAGAPYAAKIAGAKDKPTEEVARWIRHAPEVKPGTQMPTFAALINDAQAQALAEWVKQAGSR